MATAQPKILRSDKLRTAYTLVELLVVMAALTVLAAITLPSLKTLLHDQKVTSAARMVKAHFQAAQARAIASNSPVAVILERSNVDSPNTVNRLSIGQVFPPYEGDVTGAIGTLSSVGGTFYDMLTVNYLLDASLLKPDLGIFGPFDYLQIDDRQSIYLIDSIKLNTANNTLVDIKFTNPLDVRENGDLRVTARKTTNARFRLYRKPTKSFLQTLILPRGTCVDLFASGFGQQGNDLTATATGATMIVFNPQGGIAYWSNGDNGVPAITSLLHILIGRTEQVSTETSPIPVADPNVTTSFNANINDNANSWLTINPFTGAITSSGMQAGDENGTFGDRLRTARTFATYGITQSEK